MTKTDFIPGRPRLDITGDARGVTRHRNPRANVGSDAPINVKLL